MKAKTAAISASAVVVPLLIVVAAASVIPSASAQESQTKPHKERFLKNHKYLYKNHEAIKEAISSNDYISFSALTANSPFGEKITSENFHLLVEAHALRGAGDRDGAKAKLEELGIKRPRKYRRAHRRFQKMVESLNEEEKALLSEAKRLYEAGEYEDAREIMKALRDIKTKTE